MKRPAMAVLAMLLACMLLASSCSKPSQLVERPDIAKELDAYLTGLAQEGSLSASVLPGTFTCGTRSSEEVLRPWL